MGDCVAALGPGIGFMMSGDFEPGFEVPARFGPGSKVAGYLIEEKIGQGGMAVVFRARDERLDRVVALKILAPALAADEAFRQRFIRESRAAAAVDNPHVIPVFEAGEASGVLFIAMRFVRGGDVLSLAGEDGVPPPELAMEIIAQTASALDAAHALGLVHRDVKPANMLVDAGTEASDRPHVYLSDFGLSKWSLQNTGLTEAGQFLGTIDYVAPEQIGAGPVDGRADQYSLACTAFCLLTGTPPFHHPEAMAVLHAQLYKQPPLLTERRPGFPAAADAVFAKALAKDPAARYSNCRQFATALRTALRGVAEPDTLGSGLPGRGSAPTMSAPGAAAFTGQQPGPATGSSQRGESRRGGPVPNPVTDPGTQALPQLPRVTPGHDSRTVHRGWQLAALGLGIIGVAAVAAALVLHGGSAGTHLPGKHHASGSAGLSGQPTTTASSSSPSQARSPSTPATAGCEITLSEVARIYNSPNPVGANTSVPAATYPVIKREQVPFGGGSSEWYEIRVQGHLGWIIDEPGQIDANSCPPL
jgi:serine/threonine protein kinase